MKYWASIKKTNNINYSPFHHLMKVINIFKMGSFQVIGGKKLSGDITPQGAKNEALQIISAVLLTPEKVTISNIPDIIDVNLLIELLGEMNVKIDRISRDTCSFQADDVNVEYLNSEAYHKKSGKLRAP